MLTKIKLCRLNAGYTQKEVAEATGIEATVLSRVEAGKFAADERVQRKLADFYGLNPADYWDEHGWPRLARTE